MGLLDLIVCYVQLRSACRGVLSAAWNQHGFAFVDRMPGWTAGCAQPHPSLYVPHAILVFVFVTTVGVVWRCTRAGSNTAPGAWQVAKKEEALVARTTEHANPMSDGMDSFDATFDTDDAAAASPSAASRRKAKQGRGLAKKRSLDGELVENGEWSFEKENGRNTPDS